jgi:nitrogen regulatory protein P-II 1
MKLVSAVIRPHRFAAVREALRTFGALGATASEVFEHDGCEHGQLYRGQRFTLDMSPQVRLDILAHDEDAADLVRIILRVTAGEAGDGRVWVTPVESLVRVRTGQRGVDAL